MLKYLCLFSLSSALLCADSFFNTSSMQGYTGIINIPTAEVMENGKIELQFSNQVDAYRVRKARDRYDAQNYFINFGILPNLEITGRLANIEYKVPPGNYDFLDRDLSASLKYQIPFYNKYLPKIAIGIQDISGTADRYNAKYIVASKQYAFFRGTVGYGFDSSRLNGLFAGAELKANDWFYLLSEYDTQETHLGLRINTPKDFFDFGEISLMAKTNLDDENDKINIALNLKINLGIKHHSKQIYKNDTSITTLTSNTINQDSYTIPVNNTSANHIDRLKEKLVNFGFENIDIGDTKTNIYVAYENNILDHNEIDALGVILGYFVQLDLPYQTFEIVIKKSNLKVKRVIGDLNKYKIFLKKLTTKSLLEFKNSLHLNADFKDMVLKVSNENSSYFKPRVELAAGLKTFVGTEVGVFDYLVSFRPYIYTTLYKGLNLGLLADFPFLRSKEFDEDTGAFRLFDNGNKLESLMLHYSNIYENLINMLSLGIYDDQLGGFNNISYALENHTFKFKLGYLKDKDTDEARNIALATYGYYDYNYDAYVELTAGKYYNEDSGFDLQLKRYFGDTLIRFFYQNTTSEYIGIGFELPLTPRRVANTPYVQIKGKNNFSHQLRSAIRSDDGQNFVKPGGAKNPKTEFELEDRFLNRNRLTESYIKKHLLRLRDAYFTYISK